MEINLKIITVGLIFSLHWILSAQVLAQAGDERFTVKGQLKDGVTEGRINGAVITLKETSFASVSANGGNFLLENVYQNRFILNINATGYQSYQSVVNLKEDVNLGVITLFPVGYQNVEENALQKTIRATNISELFVNRPNFIGGNQVFGIPPEPKRLEGNFYLDPSWNKASIILYRDNEVIEGYFARYNISTNSFELRVDEEDMITTLPGLRVQNIVWVDAGAKVPRYFVNGMDFKEDGAPISGFFEVLVEGQLPLVRRTIASIRASNYNEALMVGERNDQIKKRNTYYYISDKNIIQVPKGKRKFFNIFGDMSEEMEEFAKDNEVNFKTPSGLFVLFTQYNSKFEGYEPLIPKLLDD
ncbi:carboxypeptidase-like regulatory domain-containing protein [Indibacter alkaliphilus]|uniref:carboxypeptidase-like regulatory domain-containing protein n=1 Tax=Indibacter alkaliphilus TaxID=579922 RepID=UPI0002824375|nr:carboxypeptidase-like regulatory domain-containing protein [Indibacter alkaliphilus]